MHFVFIIFTVLLFVLLTPAIIVRLPPKGNKLTVAFVHGLIFALIYYFSHPFLMRLSYSLEGFNEDTGNNVDNIYDISSEKQKETQNENNNSDNM